MRNMNAERPIFRPKNQRPPRDEQWEMKQAVIARDGLTTCFWCRQPFASEEDATLEHIHPIFAGGVHDLRNCTLACSSCNSRNQPRVLIEAADQRKADKEAQREANRRENGWQPCPPEYLKIFPAIARTLGGNPMTYANASFYLKGHHRHNRLAPPSAAEKHQFKAHYNRWVTGNP
jgi:5-methylcytosine-specific restriction endonuclease McrA